MLAAGADRIIYDFSEENRLSVDNGPATASYPTGQAGKMADDECIKMSVAQGVPAAQNDATTLYKDFGDISYDVSGTYHHFSIYRGLDSVQSLIWLALAIQSTFSDLFGNCFRREMEVSC